MKQPAFTRSDLERLLAGGRLEEALAVLLLLRAEAPENESASRAIVHLKARLLADYLAQLGALDVHAALTIDVGAPEERLVARLLDGALSLAEVLERSPLGKLSTARLLVRWRTAGALEPRPGRDSPSRDAPPLDTPARATAPARPHNTQSPPRGTSPRNTSPRDSSPDTSLRDSSPRDSSPNTSPRNSSPRDSSPDTSPRDSSPRDSSPNTSPRDTSPRNSSPRDSSPNTSLRDSSLRDTSPRDTSPRDTRNTPRESPPRGTSPLDTPHDAAPGVLRDLLAAVSDACLARRFDDALATLEQCAALAPNHPRVVHNLARLRQLTASPERREVTALPPVE